MCCFQTCDLFIRLPKVINGDTEWPLGKLCGYWSTNSVETVNSIDYDGYYLSELVK